jgi:hypothetical protein
MAEISHQGRKTVVTVGLADIFAERAIPRDQVPEPPPHAAWERVVDKLMERWRFDKQGQLIRYVRYHKTSDGGMEGVEAVWEAHP